MLDCLEQPAKQRRSAEQRCCVAELGESVLVASPAMAHGIFSSAYPRTSQPFSSNFLT